MCSVNKEMEESDVTCSVNKQMRHGTWTVENWFNDHLRKVLGLLPILMILYFLIPFFTTCDIIYIHLMKKQLSFLEQGEGQVCVLLNTPNSSFSMVSIQKGF